MQFFNCAFYHYLNAADECWTKVTPSHWYGAKEKTLEIISGTGLWYRTGTPPTLLRWVLVRDPAGKMEPQAFFCTDTDMDPAEIISNFAKRWEMEVSLLRRCAPPSELKPNANGPKTRSCEPHQHCSVSTVWFVSGRSRLWNQIGCHMLLRGMKKPTLHSPVQLL